MWWTSFYQLSAALTACYNIQQHWEPSLDVDSFDCFYHLSTALTAVCSCWELYQLWPAVDWRIESFNKSYWVCIFTRQGHITHVSTKAVTDWDRQSKALIGLRSDIKTSNPAKLCWQILTFISRGHLRGHSRTHWSKAPRSHALEESRWESSLHLKEYKSSILEIDCILWVGEQFKSHLISSSVNSVIRSSTKKKSTIIWKLRHIVGSAMNLKCNC